MGRMQSSVRNRQGKYVKKFYRWGKSVPWLTETTKTMLVTRSVPVRPKWVASDE